MGDVHPVTFGKYLLLDKIAMGGMAELFRAKMTGDEGFEKLIAVKKILPHLRQEKGLVESFIAEAKLAAFLQHENIIRIYDFGRMEDDFFIAMEYLFGKNLRAVLDKCAAKNMPLGLENSLYVAAGVCDGLDYAHKLKDFQGNPLNIIHRDISPPNVFISYEGQVKIVDFGIAKAASQDTTTQSGVIKGKAAYMSPEQAGGKTIDHRSDIFAVGILLYEMLTGERMFVGDTMQILARVRDAEFVPAEVLAPGLPPSLYQILRKALAKDPDFRYQTCGAMQADLEEVALTLSFRRTSKGLARTMQELFSTEIPEEEERMHAVAQTGHADSLESGPVAMEFGSGYEHTMMVGPGQGAPRHSRRRLVALGAGACALAVLLLAVFLWPRSKVPVEGMKALQKHQYAAALAAFEKAVAKDPSLEKDLAFFRARAMEGLAANLAKSDPARAKSLLQKTLALDPENAQALFRLGLIFVGEKNYPKAIAAFSGVIKINPRFTRAYFNLGFIHAMKGDFALAESMYVKAVEQKPSFLDEALCNLALVQYKQGKKEACVANLKKAVALNPNNALAVKYLKLLEPQSGGRA